MEKETKKTSMEVLTKHGYKKSRINRSFNMLRIFKLTMAVILMCNNFNLVFTLECKSRFSDLASRTLMSRTVFLGLAVSIHEHVTRDDGFRAYHNATFSVKKVLKGQMTPSHRNGYQDVLVGPFGSLNEREKCVSPPVKVGKEYLVFSDSVFNGFLRTGQSLDDLDYYEMNSKAEESGKKKIRDIEQYACLDEENCTEPPEVSLPKKGVTAKVGQKITLNCKKSGKPLPELIWLKDGNQITETKNVKIKDAKKRSRLMIRKAELSDSGSYRCSAESLLGKSESNDIKVTVTEDANKATKTTTPKSLDSSGFADLCEEHDQGYCLNGGTCAFIRVLNNKFCICTSNFYGVRCQERVVIITGEARQPDYEEKYLILAWVGAAFGALAILAVCIFVILFGRRFKKEKSPRRVQRPDEYHQIQNSDNGVAPLAVTNRISFDFRENTSSLEKTKKEKLSDRSPRSLNSHVPVDLPPNGDIAHRKNYQNQDFLVQFRRIVPGPPGPPPACTSTPKPVRHHVYEPSMLPPGGSGYPCRSASLGSRIPPDFRLLSQTAIEEKYYTTQESNNSDSVRLIAEGNIGRVQSRQERSQHADIHNILANNIQTYNKDDFRNSPETDV